MKINRITAWAEPATKESNEQLYHLVALGLESARDEMIEKNLGLVVSLVNRFLLFVPQLQCYREDLISIGNIGLVSAVNKMAAEGVVDNANPTALISACVSNELGRKAEECNMIRVPQRSRARSKKEDNVDLNSPACKSFAEGIDGKSLNEVLAYDPRPMEELRAILDACCETDEEREIMRLREEGNVDREIAEILGIPLTTTYVMRRTLYARFLEFSGWKGEA